MTKREYKVWYTARNGKVCKFRFETDKSFRNYGSAYAQTLNGIGTPFFEDMMAKVREIEAREDSAMKRNGGFDMYAIRKIECIDTKAVRFF